MGTLEELLLSDSCEKQRLLGICNVCGGGACHGGVKYLARECLRTRESVGKQIDTETFSIDIDPLLGDW